MTDAHATVKLSIEDQIAWLRLDNPAKHNALTGADLQAFITHLETVEQNPAVRVLVVTGSGNRTFCAGASLDQLSSGNLLSDQFQALTDKIADLSIPSICALNGSAYGAGAEIGLCCDFRIGVTGMKLRIPAAEFGLCYPLNGIQRYVQCLGLTTAKRLLITCEEFEGKDLLSLGYLTYLIEPEQLEDTSRDLATTISRLAPLAVAAMKQICNQTAYGSLDEEKALALIQRCHQSQDLQEGLRAVQEKRKPIFSGC